MQTVNNPLASALHHRWSSVFTYFGSGQNYTLVHFLNDDFHKENTQLVEEACTSQWKKVVQMFLYKREVIILSTSGD